MLQRVMMDGIELPRLYIAENKHDVSIARDKGIPYVRWTQGQEALIKTLLRPVLEKMFPHIRWNKVLGPRKKFKTQVTICKQASDDKDQVELIKENNKMGEDMRSEDVEYVERDEPVDYEVNDDVISEVSGISDGERLFEVGQTAKMIEEERLSIETYMGDMSSYVNIDVLQRLRLMPAFLGDILDCVKLNLTSGIYWREGYNKRLGLPVGRFDASRQLPNLIILDVSGSIPRGISATMIALIDTLRSQLTADLIITSSNSRFYAMGDDLPNPQRIRNMFGYGNEASEFFGILDQHIKGKHYGHVFSFGDDDCPEYYSRHHGVRNCPCLGGTVVEHVHHYHTGKWWDGGRTTGYAKWCHMLSKKPASEFDTSWCEVIS